MNPLVQSIIQPFINEEIQPQDKPTLAIYPGKFKPPHAGHAMVAKKINGCCRQGNHINITQNT